MEYLNNVSNPYTSKEILSRGHRTVGTGLNVNTSDKSLSNNMVTVPPVLPQPNNIPTEDSIEGTPDQVLEPEMPQPNKGTLQLANHKTITFEAYTKTDTGNDAFVFQDTL
jgi:hypothetical protein